MDESKSYPSREERLREVMDKLEDGVAAVFNSEDYPAYLNVMSKFHRYSFGNSMLIALQCPGATQVAGFHAWKNPYPCAVPLSKADRTREDRPCYKPPGRRRAGKGHPGKRLSGLPDV